MHLALRPSRSSTCPLCRASVLRSQGVECAECKAVAHHACVHEFGGCHAAQAAEAARSRLLVEDDYSPEGQRRVRERIARRAERSATRRAANAEREAAHLARVERREGVENKLLLVFGALAAVAAIVAGCKAGPKAGLAAGFFGFVFGVAWVQVLTGLWTGLVSSAEKNCSDLIDARTELLRYLLHMTFWVGMSVAPLLYVGFSLLAK